MSALILPSRRVVQPQGPVEVNQSHWAGVRCFKAITPANRHLLILGSNSAFFSGPKGVEFGASIINSSAAAVSISDPALVRTAGGVARSFLVVYRRFGGPTLTPSIFVEETPGNFFRNAFLFHGSWLWRTRDITTGDSGTARDLSVAAPVAGAIETRIFSVAPGIKKAYLNGRLDATSANGNQFTSTDSNAFQFAHASGSGADWTGDSRVSLFASFDGVFTDAEAKGLSENPWQIFRPIQRRIIVDMAAGGGDVTGSLAATEIGSDTAAFSAASTASGTLAATETGSDTAAIAGHITAIGSLAATEAGIDTAAISGGNPAAIGSMAAQEVGSDTASIAGIAPATGTLTAQETGADTASIAGASVVAGSLAATEVGSDSFFATSGAQQSVGTLAAQEVGSDTASASGAIVAQGVLTATESGGDSAIMTGEARVMGLFAATEVGQDVFSGTSIQLPARTGSMAATETGADGAAMTGQALVMGLFTSQEVGSDVFFASENDLTRIRPIQATYNTLAIDAGYNTTVIEPTYWID